MFVAPLSTKDLPAVRELCNSSLQSTIDRLDVFWRSTAPIAMAPFMVQRFIRSKHLRDVNGIYNFVPLSLANGVNRARLRYNSYQPLESESGALKETVLEKRLEALHAVDRVSLDANSVDGWIAALKNWTVFLDKLIFFRPMIKQAILEACERFEFLMDNYFYGVHDPFTQRALSEGTFMLSKQVVEALQLGTEQHEPAVIEALRLVPSFENGSDMGEMLNEVLINHANRAQTVAPTSVTSSSGSSSTAGKTKPPARTRKATVKSAETAVERSEKTAAAASRSKKAAAGADSDNDDSTGALYCGEYLSVSSCQYRRGCKFQHKIPPTAKDCAPVIRFMKLKNLERSKSFAKACTRMGVEWD